MKEVSTAIDISRSIIRRLENGTKSIDSDELKKFVCYFKTSADYILGLDGENGDIELYMRRDKQLIMI